MPQPDNVKALYNELKNTYELGSEEDFIKYLSDDKNREALRKELESEYDVGDIASFSNYLGFGTGQAAYEQYMAQRNGQSAPAAPTAAPKQPVKPMGAAATLPSWKTSAMPDDVRKRFEQQERANEHAQFTKEMDEQLKKMQGMGERMEQKRQAVAKGNSFDTSEQRYNPVTGKVETVYYTKSGDIAPSRMARDLESNEQLHKNIVKEQVAGQVDSMLGDVDKMLNEATERDNEKQRKKEKERGFWGNLGYTLAAQESANPSAARMPEYGEDVRQLQAAHRKLKSAQNTIAEAQKHAEDPAWLAEFGRGMAHGLTDISTWDFGITDLANANAIQSALEKADKGEQLTDSEQALLDAVATEVIVNEYFGSDVSNWYNGGNSTAVSIPFMASMIISPAMSAGRGASGAMARYITKRFASQAAKKGVQKVTSKVAEGALKGVSRVAIDAAAAAGHTAMFDPLRIEADTKERMMGDIVPTFDSEGNVIYGGHKGDISEAEARGKAFLNYFTENFSEMVGDYIPGMKTIFGNAKWAKKFMGNKFVHGIANMESRAQFHGFIPEMIEEIVNGGMNAWLVGDQTFDANPQTGVFSKDNLATTTISIGATCLTMGLLKLGGYGVSRSQLRKSDMQGAQLFGDDWAGIRSRLMSDNLKDVEAAADEIAKNDKYTLEQKKAAVKYATIYAGINAYAHAEKSQEQQSEDQNFDAGYEQAESPEAKADVSERLNEAQRRLDGLVDQQTLQMLDSEEYVADVYNSLPDNAKAAYNEYRQAQAAMDGVLQRISDDADIMAAQQREEAKKKQFRGEGENKGTLRPVKITQQNGEPREVFLTQGEIALTDSGLVDPEKTKEVNNVGTLTGYDPATGEEVQFTPADIVEVEPMTTAEQQEQNIEANKQAYIQQQMDAATPTATTTDPKATTSATTADNQQQEPAPAKPKGEPKEFVPGMTLTVTDREGNEHTVTTDGKRYTYNPVTGELTESENGNYLKLTDEEGNVMSYDLSGKGYGSAQEIKDYEMPKEEQPTETVEPTEPPTAEVPTAESITPQQQVTPESTHEPAPVEKADPMKAPMPMRTVTTGKGKNAKTETVPDFYAVPEEKTFDYIYNELGFTPEIADATVKANADETAKAINEHKAKEPQPMANPIAYKEAHDAWQRDLDAMNQQADYWKKVQSIRNQQLLAEAEERDKATRAERERRQKEIEASRKRDEEAYQAELSRRKAERDKKMEASLNAMMQMSEDAAPMEQMAKEFPIEQDAEAMEIMNDRSPRTLEEVVAWMLSDTKDTENKIDPELVREHTGYGKADFRKFPFIFKKGGMSPEAFGEKVEQIARENDVVFKDNENGFSALLNVLGEVGGLGDLKNYIKENHHKLAEKVHSDRLREAVARKADDKSMQQNSGMNDKQQDNYMASMEQAVESGVTMMTDEETEALFSDDAVDPFESKEENQKTNSNDTRTETNDEGGDQRGAEKGGADESEAGQAGVAADDKRGDIQLEGEPQPAEQPAGGVAEKSESKEEVKGETNESDAELDALIADYKEKQAAVNKIWNNWLKDKSGAPAKYGNSREIEQEAYDKIRKALRNVSDEQLDGLAKRLADDNLLMFLIEGEQNRREENRERANEFPNGIAEQGDISKESKPVKTDKILPDFTSRDPQHPVQNCIYYDPDGHAVATDGHVLIASKSQYDPKQKGKMVAAHKVKGAAEKGDVLEGKFPNWKSVIPAESEQKTKINLRKLANFLAGAKDIMKGEKEKESSVIVRMPNGDIVGFDPDNLQKFVQAADAMGVKEVEYGSFDKPLIGRSNDGIVVVMPKLIGTSYDGKKFYYDLSDGSIKQQKTGGEATKTSKRDRRLLEVVMDKLRNIIGDRLHTTLTEDEKGLINWANAKTKGTAPVFYSNAERAVEGIKQEKATAEQWLAMLQKNGGLKAGEDKWIGLSDWLKEQKGKSLTKQEVLDFIRDNQIQMQEVNYGDALFSPNSKVNFESDIERARENGESDESVMEAWDREFDTKMVEAYKNGEFTIDENGKVVYDGQLMMPINDTRRRYTTDFLKNKREIAFVIPNVESWNRYDDVHFGDAGEGRAVMWVRFGETTDKDGKKVLVIDEIQSNRHQEGREKGYGSKDKLLAESSAASKRRLEMADAFRAKYGIPSGRWADSYLKGEEYEKFVEEWDKFVKSPEYREAVEAETAAQEAYNRFNGVPDAPFEKNWHEVAMKRMLRYAAENGYDKVAWTTGEQQAERYNIGNVIDRISVSPLNDRDDYLGVNFAKEIFVKNKNGEDFSLRVTDDGIIRGGDKFNGENVKDVFGKELAEKIMSSDGRVTFEGDNLRIGAEGMKGFYDQILPRFMDKYGKKWGVKTTDVELPNIGDNGLTMHSVEVTPEMKKSVLEGQPMFHKVFHGSGADFERFDSSHMGEGEGAQAYGYGHYTTEVEGIGRTYAKAMGQYEYQGRKYNDIRDNWKGDDATQRVVLDVLKYLDKDNDTRSVQEAIDFSIKVKELRIARKIGDVEEAKRELDALKNLSVEDFKTSATLYTVEIPDDNGSNYLEWDKPASMAQVIAIKNALIENKKFVEDGKKAYDFHFKNYNADEVPPFEEWIENHAIVVARGAESNGERLYKELTGELGSEKAASELLHDAGLVGIKYPAQYRSGGREDGAKNYVIFDDGDLKITDKIKFFKTPQGEVFGFTVGGNIYVDMDIAKADTPIHEYGHLWVPMVRESDPEMWEDIKRVLTKDKDVKPFMDIVRQRYPELTAEGREDDFMEEVFTHFSGDNGLKMLEEAAREYEEKDGQGFISKAKAIAALNKVKEALDKFWGKVAQLFGIKFRNAREVANKMMKDFMDEVDPTKVRTERIKNEGLKPEEEKTLMGVHNISEEKLRKAMKNGGFANPSMAVIDTKNGGFDSYGDISLIPRSSLIDARTGRNAGTYSGDAYTPVYPNVEYYEGKETEQKLQELTSNLPESLGEYIRRKVSNYMDRNSNNSGLEYLFLKEHGIDMPIVHNERRYPGISTKQIAERMGVSEDLYGSDLYKEYEKMPEDQRFDFNLWLQHYGNEEDIAKVKNLIAEMQEKGKEKEANYLIDHYTKPMNFAHFDSTVYNISRDEREAGEENLSRTVEDAAIEVNKQGLRNEFDAWQQKVIDGLGYEEKLFAGYTPSGYRKYLPNTAENASKLMNKQEDTNAGNDTGLNATRSALLYKMQSLDDIRQHRDLLQGNDAYGERQSEMTDELLDLAHQLSDMQKIDDNPFINTDYAILRMQDAFTKKDPIGYLNKEYGYSIDKDSEFAKQMLDFMNEVRDLPAKYFETKFKRPVALDEFAVAVVPEGTSKDVVDALKNAGLDVRTYDGTTENRQAVTLDAVKGRDDIMFQKADNKSTEREVEPYKAPKKNDGEDLVDYAKRVAEDYEEYKKRNEKPVDAGNGKGNDGNGNGNGGNVTVDKNDVPRAVARDSYERMMDSGANQFKEAVQDSMLSLKKLYEAILGKGTKIEDVEGYKNAYLAENRMHSASQAEIGMWHKDFMEPVVKAIHELTGGKRAAYDDLVKYMMAKHGLERNAVFAERDAQAAAKKGADYDDELQKNRGRDYAGLTALTGEDDVANAEGMAQKMVDDYEAEHDTTELWNAINRATKQSLWKLASSGMMTPERYNEIRDMFSYYIPLQGFDETVAENVYSYMGNDGTIGYGTPIRHARGRKSLADDPIATMAMNGEAAIRQANRNEMKKRFLAFAQEHPSDLVSVSEVWLKHNDVTGEWEQVTADLNENDSPADVERKTMEFDEKMEQLASNDPDHYKKASDIPNVPFRVVEPSDMKQHQVLVQRGGKKYMLTINGNPRAAQALNGLTNPDVFTEGVFGKAMNLGQWLNRQLSAFYTTRNPEFVLSNFLRDAIYSNSMSWVKENPNYALKFHKNFGKMNPVHMGKLFAQWESGKLRERIKNGTASETDQLFYDFMTNGGETGWTSLRDIEKHKKELQSSLKREGSTSRKAWKALGEAFDLMNRSVENCARFAAFVTSREMGRSIDRSISDAKEVSVNFNKKGAGDKFLAAKNQNLLGKVGASMGGLGRGLYVFFNASMQGLNNIARATKRHPGKAAGVYSTLFALGALAPILAEVLSGGDDDDDKNAYYNLPEYIRRSNICFRFGKDMPWITIPLPIEFRAIYGLGELSTGALTGKERYTDEEFAKQYVSQLSQVLPLDFMEGGGGWHAFVPSMIKPYVEAQSNTSWTGLPIYRDNTFKPYDPEWTRAYSSANKQLVDATKWLNEATGGDDVTKGFIDWNPAKIEYMLKGYLGGYFTMYDRLQKTAETALGNRDFEWRNIPMASRVLREGDERTEARKLTNEYFDLVDEYNDTKHKVKEYEKISKSDREDAIKYAQKLAYLNNSEEYTRYLLMEYYKPILDQFHDMVKEADGEQSKRIKGEENALRRELINIIHSIDDGAEIDVDAAIDEMLMGILNDEQSDISLRKKAQNTIKKHRKAMAASQQ